MHRTRTSETSLQYRSRYSTVSSLECHAQTFVESPPPAVVGICPYALNPRQRKSRDYHAPRTVLPSNISSCPVLLCPALSWHVLPCTALSCCPMFYCPVLMSTGIDFRFSTRSSDCIVICSCLAFGCLPFPVLFGVEFVSIAPSTMATQTFRKPLRVVQFAFLNMKPCPVLSCLCLVLASIFVSVR